MRSQNVNPSWTNIRKIASALDVSLDELMYNPYKTDELYELYWTVPRVFKKPEIQEMICKQFITIANVTGNKDLSSIKHRIDVQREAIKSKLDDLKK